jgi:hypothetical protein
VYDSGNIMRLSQTLFDLRNGSKSEQVDELALMQDMVEQYSVLPKRNLEAIKTTDENFVVSVPQFMLWQSSKTRSSLICSINLGSHRGHWISRGSPPRRACG